MGGRPIHAPYLPHPCPIPAPSLPHPCPIPACVSLHAWLRVQRSRTPLYFGRHGFILGGTVLFWEARFNLWQDGMVRILAARYGRSVLDVVFGGRMLFFLKLSMASFFCWQVGMVLQREAVPHGICHPIYHRVSKRCGPCHQPNGKTRILVKGCDRYGKTEKLSSVGVSISGY